MTYESLLEKSISIILRKIYSRSELEQKLCKLMKENIDMSIVPQVLDRPEELELLDDNKSIEIFIRNFREKGKGKKYVEQKLSQKGYVKSLIKQNLENFENNENLEVILSKKRESLLRQSIDSNKLQEKLLRFGLSRGFSMREVLDTIRKLDS